MSDPILELFGCKTLHLPFTRWRFLPQHWYQRPSVRYTPYAVGGKKTCKLSSTFHLFTPWFLAFELCRPVRLQVGYFGFSNRKLQPFVADD